MKVVLVCPECGSDQIVRDAFAEWDAEKQEWIHLDVLDDMSCNSCSAEFKEAAEKPYA